MKEFLQRYQVMFDNMAQGAFFQSADGSLFDVNAAALSMLGLTRDEFLGRSSQAPEWVVIREDFSPLPPEGHPSMVALTTGEPVYNFVAGVYNSEKQSFVWLNIDAVPLFRPGEKTPYQAFVTIHDITEEKRLNDIHLSRIHLMQFAHSHTLEELLTESLNELEALTQSQIGFFHFYDDRSGIISLKAWSRNTTSRFCQLQGSGHYSLNEAGVWVECITQDKVVIHNDVQALPNRRGMPEGHVQVIREMLVPVRRQGHIVAIVGMGNKSTDYTDSDITTVSALADLTWDTVERMKAEALLLKAERELLTLTNTLMDGFQVVSFEGKILAANETVCQIYGYTMEEMLDKNVRDLEAVEDCSSVTAHAAAVKERGYDRFQTRHHTKSDRVIDVEISTAYVREDNVFLTFIRDITIQKQMQEELLRSKRDLELANELLEHRVNERTAELQSAIREQESFSYSVSHDLRAPLRHINSYCAILDEDHAAELSEEARGYLHRMRGASNRMGALIDHLLELSRVIRAEIKYDPVDLTGVAVRTLRMLRETEPHRVVEERIEPGLTVWGDHHLLRQLLENLLQNAWKYSSRKAPSTIEVGRKVINGTPAYFVKDNGAGFDMNYIGKLFRPFERLHGSEFEGIGIGLATAERIVHRHGGRIWGEGVENEGATFYFTLG